MKPLLIPLWLLTLAILTSLPKLKAQPAVANTKIARPELFEPGKISDGFANRDMAISADGTELFYTIQFTKGLYSVIMQCVKKNGAWGQPEVAGFSGRYNDLEPSFSPDGKKLYFSSNRPVTDTGKSKDYDIWFVTKVGGTWQNPQNLGAPVNTPTDEFYACAAKSGNIYFTRGSYAHNDDIMVCRYLNGQYQAAERLGDSINTDGYEFNAYVDPDETFIIYTAYRRPDGVGSGDLYISWKNGGGEWGKAINLTGVNSPNMDYCPFVSADKKWLYFTSDRPVFKTPFETALDVKKLHEILGLPGNGFDDIYRVSFNAATLGRH